MQPSKPYAYLKNHRLNSKEHPVTNGIQFYILVFVSILLAYELIIQIFVLPPGRPIPLDGDTYNKKLGGAEPFSIEIFSAPKPFLGEDREVNLRAIRSWQNLVPRPKITLLGYETGYDTVSSEYGLNLHPEIDKSFLGVPLFNSMVHVANQSTAKVSVIINGDIILVQDFINAIGTVLSRFDDFLVVSARYDLDALPEGLEEDDPKYYEKLRTHARENGTLHTYGGMDLWAWNTKGSRLFDPEMPHFIFGRGKYDNWLTHETIAAGRRAVIDASETILSIHIKHGYRLVQQEDAIEEEEVDEEEHVLQKRRRKLLGGEKAFWSKKKKTKFELFINIYLSLHVGSYENQHGTILFAPWRLASCLEERGNCFLRRLRPGVCNCEYSPSCAQTQTDQILKNGSRVIRCGMTSFEASEDYEIPISSGYDRIKTFGMPLTLPSLAERVSIDDTLVLTASSFGHRNMLMNWVCNMRRRQVTNFVIAALDPDLYRFAFVHGLPVYLDDGVDAHNLVSTNNSAALLLQQTANDSPEFFRLVKMKSRVIIEVLKLGYDVVWTDIDVVWLRNPIPHLQTFGVDLAVQSNARDDEAANAQRRVSSGFYLARAKSTTIKAFEEIITHATATHISEQWSFSDVLCGKNGERRLGNDSCIIKNSNVKFLDRTLYPNGATQGIWDVSPGTLESTFPHIYIVRNNLINGMDQKWRRLRHQGFIFFEQKTGLCEWKC